MHYPAGAHLYPESANAQARQALTWAKPFKTIVLYDAYFLCDAYL